VRTPAVLLLIVCGLGAARAGEPPLAPEAQARLDRGLRHYAARAYQEAIAEFQAAYQLDARPDILFAWAQAERLSGDCASAMPLYRRYLAGRPPRDNAEVAGGNLARCERALATGPGAVIAARGPSDAPVLAAPPARPAEGRWYRDPIGGALVGAGALGLAVGAGFLVAAGSAEDDRAGAATYREFETLSDRAASRRRIGVVALAVGGGLVAAGAVRWVLRARGGGEPAAGVAIWTDGRGGGVALGARF
jgi:tetratricopeptide (TPR) repeat protein